MAAPGALGPGPRPPRVKRHMGTEVADLMARTWVTRSHYRIEPGLEIRTNREIDLSPLRPGEEVRSPWWKMGAHQEGEGDDVEGDEAGAAAQGGGPEEEAAVQIAGRDREAVGTQW